MDWRRVSRWLGLAAAIAVLASAEGAFAQTGTLVGNCKDEKGQVMVGYTIQIERKEIKGSYHVKTDKKGNYVYVGLPIGNYDIALVDPNGKKIWEFKNKHVGIGDQTDASFDMAKEKAVAQKEQSASPEGQKLAEAQKKNDQEYAAMKTAFEQGNALYDEKKYAEAAAMYEQALPLAKDRNMVIVLARLADAYRYARQYDKSVDNYQKALSLIPNDSNLHNSLGSAYAEMGKIPEAQAEFQKSAELNPAGASRAYFNLGVVMYNKGRMDEAAQALKKATEVDPTYADAFFWMGQALFGKATTTADGKIAVPPGTSEAFQKYLQLDPNGKHMTEAQAVLQTIQGQVQTEFKVEKKRKKG